MTCENETVKKIFRALDSKKAKDIMVLKISELTTMADYFIIATGGSDRQVKALADYVEETLKKEGISPTNKEGYRGGEWVLLGYDEAIVHIFQSEPREFYNLERIWQDAPEVDMSAEKTED